MEIVTIEKKTFELWQEQFKHFINRMDALCIPLWRKQDKWLDNCETCRLLNVSARTMQTYRDTGKLPYSQINNKIYYKISDVETFMQNHVKNNSKK
ncbi:helix-turn-helix domain-containing protein [uncultured Parabacteroides sp.]|uniref:helix-turn-helix domain-containing protein n=1 Tax=uncultured Parabacteroides sp. TaxID=512312 RepID=UPI00259B7186|nr:helix-turn-helix domain-containing protein [uncultured Parabacteroides sp.]